MTVGGNLTLIRTYVDICQHRFFLFDCTRPLHASSAPFTDEGKILDYYCSDIKMPNCFYKELFAFYLNRNTC